VEEVMRLRPVLLAMAILLAAAARLAAQQPDLPADYEARVAALEQQLRANPDDLTLLDALAGSYAMGQRYEKALELVRRMFLLSSDPAALRFRLVQLLAWSGRPGEALAELRTAPRLERADAVEFECQLLTAAPQPKEAAACYERLLAGSPDSSRRPEFELQAARNWSWGGEARRAIAKYEAYFQEHPSNREAALELIRLRRHRGDYERAERLCNLLLAAHPEDAEVLALKAEVLYWAGHKWFQAHRAASQAVRLAPQLPEALVAQVYTQRGLGERRRALQSFAALEREVRQHGLPAEAVYADAYRLLERDFSHRWSLSQTPAYAVYNDSDAIRNVYSGWQLAVPVAEDHTLRIDAAHYRSAAPENSLFTLGRHASRVNEAQAGGVFLVAPGAHLTLLGGASRRSASQALRGIFDARLEVSPADRWSLEFASSREFLKLTPRAVDRDISSYRLAAGAQYHFNSRTSLAVDAARRYWSDANRSFASEATLKHILYYRRPFMVDAGILNRWERFERDTKFAAGFFTPEHYWRHDSFLGLHGEIGRHVTYEMRGAGGAQKLAKASPYRSNWEFASSASLWFTRQLGLYASYQRRNYSLLARTGWYQGFYFGLTVRQ
jgi:Flp pilus assembly protein TadD